MGVLPGEVTPRLHNLGQGSVVLVLLHDLYLISLDTLLQIVLVESLEADENPFYVLSFLKRLHDIIIILKGVE